MTRRQEQSDRRRLARALKAIALVIPLAASDGGSGLQAQQPQALPVGFTTLRVADDSRPAVGASIGVRSFPAFVWYPAIQSAQPPLRFGAFIRALGAWAAGADSSGRRVFADRIRDLGAAAQVIHDAALQLPTLATGSIQGARPATGRFPVVFFPEYSAPAGTSFIAEQLARRGMVVVAIPMLGSRGIAPDNSARGLETMALDLTATARTVGRLPYVDLSRTGAMGVGIAASGVLAWHLMSSVPRALVSLEGGITTQFEIDMIRRLPFFDPSRVVAPLLAITAPHPSVDARRLDLYTYAEQLRVHYPKMGEFWFLNYGKLDGVVPGIIGAPPGPTAEAFDAAVEQVARFFLATLGTSRMPNAGELTARLPSGLFDASRVPARPLPPPADSLVAVLRRAGSDGLEAELRTRATVDADVLPASRFIELLGALAPVDSAWSARLVVSRVWRGAQPQAVRAHRAFAQASLARGDSASAREAVQEALARIDEDPDPTLESVSARRALAAQLRAMSVSLGGGESRRD